MSAVLAVISRSLLHRLGTEHLLFRKLCARRVLKRLPPEHKAMRMESALTTVVHLFLHLKKFLSGERFQNDRDECHTVQWFKSQAADFYDTGYKNWSHSMTNVSIPEVC